MVVVGSRETPIYRYKEMDMRLKRPEQPEISDFWDNSHISQLRFDFHKLAAMALSLQGVVRAVSTYTTLHLLS